MQNVTDYLEKADKWRSKVAEIENKTVNIRVLQSLINEHRQIPVKFDEVHRMKERYSKGQDLLDKMHKLVHKNNKTRQSGSKSATNKIDTVIVKKETKCREDTVKGLMKQLNDLKVYNSETQRIKGELADIEQWKNRMEMILEDDRAPKTKESLSGYMKEAQIFRFEVQLVRNVQNKLDLLEWKEKAKQVVSVSELKKLLS